MMGNKVGIKGILFGIGLTIVILAWCIGGFYQNGVFLGPYILPDRGNPVYFEFPVINNIEEDGDAAGFKTTYFELADFKKVAVYEISLISFNKVRPYPLTKSFPDPLSMDIHFLSTVTVNEAQKVIDVQTKHPKYLENRLQLVFYRFAGAFAWFVQFQQVYMAIALICTLLWLRFCKSATPFFVWWWLEVLYALVHHGLYTFHRFATVKSFDWFLYDFGIPTASMYPWPNDSIPLPHYVGAAGFYIIGPILFLIMGWVYVTEHVIPKQKRLFEDFFKIDKDKEKRKDFNVTDVEFKLVKYDLKKKIEEYRNRPEFFLGVDDNGNDVSISEQLTNQHLHIMGPTGCGKTATLMLPLAIQAIEKGSGACLVDFKGDYSLIKSVQEKCKQVGKKFYFFSIDPRERTESYNPLSSGDSHSKANRIICALKLEMDGPASYYENQQYVAFLEIIKHLITLKQYISFPKILVYLRDSRFLERLGIKEENVSGLVASLSKIADYPMINEEGIDLKKIMDEGSVVYFNLRSQINTDLAEAIGRMLIVDFKFWSSRRSEHDPKFFIFIDEFQTIASQFFIDIISKVRSANLCLVLANQSRGNLMNVSKSFHDAVMSNSFTKVVFNQFEDAKFWANATGTIRVEEAMMRMESGEMFNEEKTALDGKRVRDGVMAKVTKPLFSENVFLKLPKGKSVVFVKGRTACMTNHEFYHTEAEFKEILKWPFQYENGKLYGDPLDYLNLQKANVKAETDKGKGVASLVKQVVKGMDESTKTKKENKKGEKDESNKTITFGPNGDDIDKR